MITSRSPTWEKGSFRPLGYDWQIGIGIISSFAAREVIVSTLAVVYGVGSARVDQDRRPDRVMAFGKRMKTARILVNMPSSHGGIGDLYNKIKTLPEAKGEVRRAINIFRYFAGEGSRLPGMLVPSERDRVHMFALRKPIGVVGLITPWNFPSAIPAWKLAPALICGNTVVLKPASAAPLLSQPITF